MAPSKRKRPQDDEEAVAATAQAGKTRRVTRQTSIPPPPLPVPPKEQPQRRALRGNTSSSAAADDTTDTKTRQGTRRTRRTSTNEREPSNDEDDEPEAEEEEDEGGEEEEEEEEDEEDKISPAMTRATRGRQAKASGQAEPEEGPRQLRGGKTLPARPGRPGRPPKQSTFNGTQQKTAARPETAKRTTRQAVKDSEVADSEAGTDEAEEEADEEAEDGEDDEENEDGEEEEEEIDDTEDELAGPATILPPRTQIPAPPLPSPAVRRPKRANGVPTSITPVSPPKIPSARPVVSEIVPPSPPPPVTVATAVSPIPAPILPKRETAIKPPAPLPLSSTSPAALARPKTVTEIKPPASPPAQRYPKTTPIQPPPIPTSPTQLAPLQPRPLPQPQKPKAVQQLRDEALPKPQQQPNRTPKQTVITTTASNNATAATAPRSATTPTSATSQAATSTVPPSSPSQPDRNIDKVVLGEICFKAWYPSYYGKEVLGDTAGNSHHGRGSHQAKGAGKENQVHQPSHHYQHSHHSHSHGHGHGHSHGGKDAPPMLDRLYVCPFCFKYSKEIVPWHGHVQVCESQFQIPGEKVYVHPKGVRTIRVPVSSTTPKGKRKRVSSEADIHYVEQVVKDEGEWSIWEVDGEKDVLFCQNLSLFAKLFLDNKSVFFDVTGFYYFLLVYTPPPSLPSSLRAAATATASPMSSANANGQASILGAAPRPRVVGFFSKEKMSWDNNNLACILVFPPWQRKGLGALLMGISYEISRREGILGGPEKPISDLGKKGYKRFWGSEIARWLLSVDITTATSSLSSSSSGGGGVSSSSTTSFSLAQQTTAIPPPTIPPPYGLSSASTSTSTGNKGTKGGANSADNDSLVIDIDDCSRATWIVRDDCLYVLRDMGIVEDAGMGLPKKYCENVLVNPDEQVAASDDPDAPDATSSVVATNGVSTAAGSGASASAAQNSSSSSSGAQAGNGAASGSAATGGVAAGGAVVDPPREVQRVRLSKAAVRQWVKDNRINLEKACDPAGFIKVYTNKEESQQAAEET